MWLSNYWYEKLPLVYLLAALIVLLALGSHGVISSLSFLAAAGLTRWWRVGKYRRLIINEDGSRRRQATRKPRGTEVSRSA